mmetsp:Transcript_37661/g.118764  ORF Transcript_37661/g.118764 Transcript_37661/m.118764 type:complete len:1376 (+) Transcript_37661:207-4334(+)
MRKLFTVGEEENGRGKCLFTWSPNGSFLATGGTKLKVSIFDRSGRLHDEVHLPNIQGQETESHVLALQWDAFSEKLAILQNNSTSLIVWSASTRESQRLDTGMKDLAFLAWAKNSPILAVGTGKGNLLIYNDQLGKKIPIMGKHTRKINCGTWNKDNWLALGSEDRQITISRPDGDTIRQMAVKAEPLEIRFSDKKDTRTKEQTVSINVGKKTLYLFKLPAGEEGMDVAAQEHPIELAFQERYGQIQSHYWFGDGYIIVGFQSGTVVIISTHNREMSEEVHSGRYHHDVLNDLAYSPALNRAASVGGNVLKVLDLMGTDIKELKSDCVEFPGGVVLDRVEWTTDGQVLSASTANGEVHTFLASLPVINAAYEQRLVYLTSLLELSVIDVLGHEVPSKIEIETEPAFVALGHSHVAVGMNNQAWFYRIPRGGDRNTIPVNQRDYLGTIDDISLNERYAAVLSEGRVHIHVIEAGEDPSEHEDLLLPDKGHPNDVTCMSLTRHFVVYGTARGSLSYFYLEDRASVNEFRHDDGAIKRVWVSPLGTRCIFVDERHQAYLFNPVNDLLLPVPRFSGKLDHVLWDSTEPSLLVLVDSSTIYTYVYSDISINGPVISLVGTTPRPHGFHPVVLHMGSLTCQLSNSSLETIILDSHRDVLDIDQRGGMDRMRRQFAANLSLLRLRDAWDCALVIRSPECWEELALAGLTYMDLDLAIRVYRHVGSAGMVLSLESIRYLEDKNLLAGHIAVLLGDDTQHAQELFLKSSRPITALEMRKDLKSWDEALKLAKQLDPTQLADISREYGQMLEMRCEYEQALNYYERAVQYPDRDPAKDVLCHAGIARMTLHMGDLRRGRQLALDSGNPQLCRDCAIILEGMNQLHDAAELYERGGLFEKAASIYIATKSFAQAQPLMARISTPKLHGQYARAKEAEGKYADAADAYESAKDLDNMVRILLDHLSNAGKAFSIVRRSRSVEGANMVAKFCAASGDHQASIEFLLMARRGEEAFHEAEAHECMDAFVDQLGEHGEQEDYVKCARYFETKGSFGKAGHLYERCGQHAMALRNYLKCGGDEIQNAINVVGAAKNDALTNQLVDFLMGETDGVQKDHNYLFQLHMALGNHDQAAQTSVLIARQEQEMGNYKLAHSQLFDTYKELDSQQKRPPQDLHKQLMLLHSYILVKSLVKLGDHEAAARMLIRVGNNISKFPSHVVPILTSTVIECQRANLKKTAFDYASMLMRPEYRQSIAAAYKKKIENIVRRPDKETEADEPMTPCPHCTAPGPSTQLECHGCKNIIPYCIATGRRMVLNQWSQCPSCHFPALFDDFTKLLQTDRECPMCNTTVSAAQVQRMSDPVPHLRKHAGMLAAAEQPPARASLIEGVFP